ncbi:MAG: hypothetical protein J6V72_05230 [Kiritimatiellae bacterium]|nr:hypothetical protein [Kiritimatiellia bacterium]
MISHRQIMNNAATAVCNNVDVLNYCVQHFGRGLDVHVGAYAQVRPGEKNSPFLWITPIEENEALKEDDLFSVMFCVGGLVKGENGEKVIENVVTPRTASANGLTLNGGNAIVEDLRDIIMRIVRNAHAGAIVNRIRREENDISHFPLEWATFYVEYLEPESLAEGLV